ncbi:MAG TPA: hypothetical protein VF456_08740, partial [Vicinamibacterales bacterium]
MRLINALNVATFRVKDETSNPRIRNQHIRTAAEYRDRNAGFARELERQESELGVFFDHVVVCTVTGSTQAG